MADIDGIIDKALEVHDPATYMMTPDGERELQFQKDLVETCYVKPDTAASQAVEPTSITNKRKKAQDLCIL